MTVNLEDLTKPPSRNKQKAAKQPRNLLTSMMDVIKEGVTEETGAKVKSAVNLSDGREANGNINMLNQVVGRLNEGLRDVGNINMLNQVVGMLSEGEKPGNL